MTTISYCRILRCRILRKVGVVYAQNPFGIAMNETCTHASHAENVYRSNAAPLAGFEISTKHRGVTRILRNGVIVPRCLSVYQGHSVTHDRATLFLIMPGCSSRVIDFSSHNRVSFAFGSISRTLCQRHAFIAPSSAY